SPSPGASRWARRSRCSARSSACCPATTSAVTGSATRWSSASRPGAAAPSRGARPGTPLATREPAGVVGAITPWNYPLHQIVAKVAAALAAGCTVVLKPSEVAPLAAYELASILGETGLPAG